MADLSTFDSIFQAAGDEWNVDPRLLKAVATQESGGNTRVVSRAGAQGLMQIIPTTQKYLGVTDPTDPVQSIYGAAKYLNEALDKEGSPERALLFYHGGPEWRQRVGPESAAYVPAVTAHYQRLAKADRTQLAAATPSTATDAPPDSAPAPAASTGAGKAMPEQDYSDFLKRTGAATSGDAGASTDADHAAFLARTGAVAADTGGESTAATATPPLGIGGQVVGTLGAVTKGMSLGAEDPLTRLTNYLLPDWWTGKGSDLDKKLQANRQQFQAEHPLMEATGEAVGAVPAFALGEGALARVIPGAIGAGYGVLSKGANLLGASIRNAVVSGAASAGLTEGDATSRAEGAGEGAAVGAVVPGVFAGLGKVLGSVASPIMARLASGAAESQATSKIAEAAARDGMTVGQLATNLKALGPQATLADAGGRNVQQLAAGVANKPGEAAQLAQQVLGDRAAQAPQVVNDAITAATGSTGDYHAALAKLGAQRSADAGPLYDQAFSQPLPAAEGAAAQRFMQGPVGDKALQNAMRVIQTEKMTANEAFNLADYGVKLGDSGRFVVDPSAPPNLRLLDAVKGGYDDIVEGYRDTTTGKLNLDREGYAANNARAQLVSELRDASPTYAKALDAWGGPSQAMDAISMGRRALSNDPEVNAATIAKLTDTNKEFFKTGVARALKDKVDSAQEGADVTRRIFGNTLIRNKIAAAFGDPGAFDAFQTTMEQQAKFAQTKNAITAGSRTAPLGAAMADAGADYITPAAMLLHGNVPGAAMHIAGQGYNALADASGPRMAAVGRQMFAQPPTNELMNALDQRLMARTNPLTARNAARALAVMEANRLFATRPRE